MRWRAVGRRAGVDRLFAFAEPTLLGHQWFRCIGGSEGDGWGRILRHGLCRPRSTASEHVALTHLPIFFALRFTLFGAGFGVQAAFAAGVLEEGREIAEEEKIAFCTEGFLAARIRAAFCCSRP